MGKSWVFGLIFGMVMVMGSNGDPQVPRYFIFGDSLVDNGNNNRLSSLARTNYFPNGIDFPQGPTGRFSNGRTTIDVIALYNYGARKVAMIGIGQNGCSPNDLVQRNPDGTTCVEAINVACQLFDNYLKSLVKQFHANFPDPRFIYVHAYGIFQDLINRTASFGFSVTNAGCCGVGKNNGQITCLPLEMPCQNWDKNLFRDAFHPSDAASRLTLL